MLIDAVTYHHQSHTGLMSGKNFELIFSLCSLGILLCFLSLWGGVSMLTIALVCLLIVYPLVAYCEKKSQIRNLLSAYIIAVSLQVAYLCVLLLLYDGDSYPMTVATVDARGYLRNALFMSPSEIMKLTYGINTGYALFLNYIASAFNVAEDCAPIVLIVPNLFISPFLAVFACILTKHIVPSCNHHLVFWLLALEPTIVRYSLLLMKDITVCVLVSFGLVAFLFATRFLHYILAGVATIIVVFAIGVIRLRAVPLITFFMFIRLWFRKDVSITSMLKWLVVSAVLIVALLFISDKTVPFFKPLIQGVRIASTEKRWQNRVRDLGASSAGHMSVVINNLPTFPLRTIARAVTAIIIPFPPVQFHRVASEKFGFRATLDIGAIYWHAMVPFLLIGAWRMYRDREYPMIVCFLIVIFAMSVSGWLDVRWRLMGIVPAYIIVAKGIKTYVDKKNLFPYFYYSSVVVVWSIYGLFYGRL